MTCDCGTNETVLVPYKITLLSNYAWILAVMVGVLVPYKITLLSNRRPVPVVNDLF